MCYAFRQISLIRQSYNKNKIEKMFPFIGSKLNNNKKTKKYDWKREGRIKFRKLKITRKKLKIEYKISKVENISKGDKNRYLKIDI